LDNIKVKESKMLVLVGNVTYTGERRNVSNVLVGKHSGKRARLRPNRRWTDSIKKLYSVNRVCICGIFYICSEMCPEATCCKKDTEVS